MEDTKKIDTYINEMNNYDPDLQEMGAKYLSELVQNGKVNLKADPNLARKITENFLKQVGSTNFVVHSSAIRELADMVPYIPKDQLVNIFHQIISAIAKVNTPHDRRQVFSTSAGTMIHHAPQQLGIVISDLFVQSIQQLLKIKQQNTDIEMLLLNVITEFARKWPNVAGNKQVKFNRELLIQHLLRNIERSSKLLLIRKSDGALGKLAIIFNQSNFELIFNHKQLSLMNFVRRNINCTQQDDLKNLRNGIVSISSIARVHNSEMRPWVRQIAMLALQVISARNGKDVYIDLETQVIENSIMVLNYLIRGYASELHDLMAKGALQNFIEECLNFDLQGMMSYMGEQMEVQDQYEMEEQFFNEDTVCWKVRAAILRYITTLMHKNKHFRENKAKQKKFIEILVNKLVEDNENVSRKGFECFNYIIQSISIPKDTFEDDGMQLKRVKSSQGDFAMDIIRQISDQIQFLFKNTKTKQQVKTEASKTLLKIIELLKDRIIEHDDINMKLLDLIQNLVVKIKLESAVNLIRAIRFLLSPHLPQKQVENVINLLLSFIKNKNFKIVAASFSCLKAVLKTYQSQLLKGKSLDKILQAILVKLKQHDADKLVKSNAIKCLGPIYKNIFVNLPENQQNSILDGTLEKLKVEIDKSLILQQISNIPVTYSLKQSQKTIANNLLKESSDSLGTNNFELNTNAIQSCDVLLRIQVKSINDNLTIDILNRSKPMIADHKIPKYIQLLMDTHPKAFKNFTELIIRTTDIKYIVKMVENKIEKRDTCINILKSIAKSQNSKNISIILGKLKLTEQELSKEIGGNDHWGLICVGALGYIGDKKTFDYLLNFMKKDINEEVKLEAAKALGNITSRNPGLLNIILKQANSSQDNYLYIVAMKQMLLSSTKTFEGFSELMQFMFKKSEQSDRQTYQYIISESIGRGITLNQQELKQMMNSYTKMTPSRLFIFASALKYALENYKAQDELSGYLEQYIHIVSELSKHKDVNVRCAALKSLNSIANSFKKNIKNITNEAFIQQTLDNMEIKQQLIVIVDYGVNKEKKDLGRPLRIQAFNFIRAIIDHPKLQGYNENIVKKCLEKLTEQTSNDLILKRVNLIKKICEKDFTAFIPHQNEFAKGLGIEQGVLKSHQKQTQTDDQRNQGYLKNLLKQIIAIRKISDNQSSDICRALINHIKSSQRLNKIIQSIELQN